MERSNRAPGLLEGTVAPESSGVSAKSAAASGLWAGDELAWPLKMRIIEGASVDATPYAPSPKPNRSRFAVC